MKDLAGVIISISLFCLYIFGMYNIIVDDHRYTTKDVFITVAVFPYAWWVGGKEAYKIMTVSKTDREFEEKCLDASEALRMPRNSRLRFCECFTETKNKRLCAAKIFGK